MADIDRHSNRQHDRTGDEALKSDEERHVRILVADDHELAREGLVQMLASQADFEVVGHAWSGRTAIEQCERLQPDVVFMDVGMPQMDGIEATRLIKGSFPSVAVIMLTLQDDPDSLRRALQAGADGYILKDATRQELAAAVRGALSGKAPVDDQLAATLLRELSNGRTSWEGTPKTGLSARECEVLGLVASGLTNPEIARRLFLSVSTVKAHVEHIIAKLDVGDRTQAAVRAFELGLLQRGMQETTR